MTVVVESGDGKILAFTKGADSSILPKCIAGPIDETKINVSNFSVYGFRTLCVAYREIANSEWNVIKTALDAETIKDDGNVLQVGQDLIEKDFILIGSTAVEDRLQDGVPETLRALKEAGIKVCMITGDKRETAINIARSCGLISTKRSVYTMLSQSHLFGGGQFIPLGCLEDIVSQVGNNVHNGNDSNRVRLNHSDDDFGRQVWNLAARDMDVPTSRGTIETNCPLPPRLMREMTRPDCPAILKGQFSMVIDGISLQSILASETSTLQLVNVLTFEQCEAVVFCRVSPKQKGEIVRLVKEHLVKREKGKTKQTSVLAIGDGANDINMIKMANVGVGIAGNEGSQAANCADYSICQFADLYRLIFIHGRWNYRRTTLFINIFMYKNFLFTMCQFWFATNSLFSGQTVFDDWYVLLYNSIFCFVPLFIMGVIDKDLVTNVNDSKYWREVIVPQIYKRIVRFSEWSMLKWCLIGTLQSLIVHYFVWGFWQYTNTAESSSVGLTPSLWMSSLLSYTCIVTIVSFVNMWVTFEWTRLFIGSVIVLNFGLYFAFVFAYNLMYYRDESYMGGVASEAMSTSQFWWMYVLVVFTTFSPFVIGPKIFNLIQQGGRHHVADIIRSRRPSKREGDSSGVELATV
jgi:phospholipid-translocating P-type ATPase (flippase)